MALARLRSMIKTRLLPDLFERAAVLFLFSYFLVRMTPRYYALLSWGWANFGNFHIIFGAAFLIVSEALAVCIMTFRPLGQPMSGRPLDWILGFSGAAVPLLVHPAAAAGPFWITEPVMITGLVLQIFAKIALWTSFGVVPARRRLRTDGPYSFVRHPIYLGYSLTHMGFLIGYPSTYNAALYASVLLIDVSRLLREEQFFSSNPAYLAYSKRVRYRMIPGIF